MQCYECLSDVESNVINGTIVKQCKLCKQPIDAKGMPYRLTKEPKTISEIKLGKPIRAEIKHDICYFNDCDNEEATTTTNDRSKVSCDKCAVRLRYLDYRGF